LLYSLISGRLQGTIITAPLVFIIFGFTAGAGGLDLARIDLDHAAIHLIAEFTRILVLFTDAAPLAARFGRLTKRMGECEENRPACELPLREGPVQIQSIAQRRNN